MGNGMRFASLTFLLFTSLLLAGCTQPIQNDFQGEVGKIQAADAARYGDQGEFGDLDSVTASLQTLKSQGMQSIQKEEDKKAFEAFADYKIKLVEAQKQLSQASSFSPADAEKPLVLQQTVQSFTTISARFSEVRAELDSFESNHPNYASLVNLEAEKARVDSYVQAAATTSKLTQEELDKMPTRIPSEIEAGDFEAAKKIVIEKIVGDGPARVFSTGEVLEAGTEVKQDVPPGIDGLVFKTDAKTVFFWVDDLPGQPFAHPTRYAFVYENGDYIVFNAGMWPSIGGRKLWIGGETGVPGEIVFEKINLQPPAGEGLLYTPIPVSLSLNLLSFQGAPAAQNPLAATNVLCKCGTSKVYALIVQGGNDSMFNITARGLYNALKFRGVNADNITYLTPPESSGPGVDATTSKDALKNALLAIRTNARCCDVIFLYFGGHGDLICRVTWKNMWTGALTVEEDREIYKTWSHTRDCPKIGETRLGIWEVQNVEKNHAIHLGADWLMADELDSYLDTIKNCNTHIFIDSCHSGGAIEQLKNRGRFVTTSSEANKVSWGKKTEGMSTGSGLVDALNGNAAGADANGDGTVTLDEATAFARSDSNKRSSNTGLVQRWTTDMNSNPQYWESADACICDNDCGDAIRLPSPSPGDPIASPSPGDPVSSPSPSDPVSSPTPTPYIPSPSPSPTYYPSPSPSPSPPPDYDHDGVSDSSDNCPYIANPGQHDEDNDGIGSVCDELPIDCQEEMPPLYNEVAAQGSSLSQESCAALANVEAAQCTTTCGYVNYKIWTWSQTAKYACCFRDVDYHACSNCPGQNPVCPDPELVCTGPTG